MLCFASPYSGRRAGGKQASNVVEGCQLIGIHREQHPKCGCYTDPGQVRPTQKKQISWLAGLQEGFSLTCLKSFRFHRQITEISWMHGTEFSCVATTHMHGLIRYIHKQPLIMIDNILWLQLEDSVLVFAARAGGSTGPGCGGSSNAHKGESRIINTCMPQKSWLLREHRQKPNGTLDPSRT